MEGILWTLGAGAAAVFGVALAVSTWEHLRPAGQRKALPPPPPAPRQPVVAVDVDIGAPPGDAERRRGILDEALQRMTQPGALGDDNAPAWIETAPMVGPRVEKPPQPQQR